MAPRRRRRRVSSAAEIGPTKSGPDVGDWRGTWSLQTKQKQLQHGSIAARWSSTYRNTIPRAGSLADRPVVTSTCRYLYPSTLLTTMSPSSPIQAPASAPQPQEKHASDPVCGHDQSRPPAESPPGNWRLASALRRRIIRNVSQVTELLALKIPLQKTNAPLLKLVPTTLTLATSPHICTSPTSPAPDHSTAHPAQICAADRLGHPGAKGTAPDRHRLSGAAARDM